MLTSAGSNQLQKLSDAGLGAGALCAGLLQIMRPAVAGRIQSFEDVWQTYMLSG